MLIFDSFHFADDFILIQSGIFFDLHFLTTS